MKLFGAVCLSVILASIVTLAQTIPVPLINQPLVPTSTGPGGTGFTLAVNGTGFVSGSIVNWNGGARTTTFVNGSQVTADILSADIATAGTAWVTVSNPSPGGGSSNVAFFEITTPTSSVAFATSSFGAATCPYAVATGDFDGNGKLDIVVTNECSSNISVLLGNGDGTFQTAVDYATGTTPHSVAVGDFNGDGKLDLAVANVSSSDVSVLLGNGDGTFQASVSYGAGSACQSVAVGDFNGDGKLDLAVANSSSNNVSVLLGNGDGTFLAPVNYDTGTGAGGVAVGDFNGDGVLDLAVANTSSNNVSVLVGKGDGTFQAAVNSDAGAGPFSVVVGDLNGDGFLDLAVADDFGGVSVLLGKGDGTFQAPVNYSAGVSPTSVTVGDLNADGKLDLAVANNVDNNASVLLGNGDGTFQTVVNYAAGANPISVAVGDFKGNGRLDLAVTDYSGNAVSALLQPDVVPGPNAFLAPTGLIFPKEPLGTPSPAESVMLSNYGTATLNIVSITASGDFSQTNTCGASVAAGASCTISVIFNPTQQGTRAGTLSITDNAPDSPQGVTLSGTGTVVSLVPSRLGFSCTPMPFPNFHCECVRQRSTTLTNVGSTTLSVNSIFAAGPFFQTNNCGASVAAGQSCNITVGWSLRTGSGAVSIQDNAIDTPQTVPLFGFARCRLTASDFSLSASTLTPSTVSPGGASTSTVDVAAIGQFSGSVALSCSVVPSSSSLAPTCSVTPSSTTPGTSATLAVRTTGPTARAGSLRAASGHSLAGWLPLIGLIVMVVGFGTDKTKRGKIVARTLACMVAAGLVFQVACGGGSSGGGGGGGGSAGTPIGSYTITVTGTSGTLVHTVDATLTVN